MAAGHDLLDPQAGDAVALFLTLYLGHILGDFVFQPGRLVLAKRKHQRAVVVHAAIVAVCTALVGAATLRDTWPAVLFAAAAHFGVEHVTIRARRTPQTSGLTVFLLDQGLHIISLVLIAVFWRLPSPVVIGPWHVSLGLLAAVCAIATVAFGGSILIFEIQLRATTPRMDGPDPVLGLDWARLFGVAERAGALTAALLLPVPVLGALAFAPRIAYALAEPRRRAHHFTAAGTGLAMCAVAWVFVTSANLGL